MLIPTTATSTPIGYPGPRLIDSQRLKALTVTSNSFSHCWTWMSKVEIEVYFYPNTFEV